MWSPIRRILWQGTSAGRLGDRVFLCRAESTIAAEPRVAPLLQKIKSDLKTAMKAKDRARLDVLRSLIAETNNAAKTAKPIETDIQLLALLKKRINSGQESAAQFKAANRDDLVQKEMGQVQIVDEYVSKVQVLSEERVDSIIKQATEKLKTAGGQLNEGSIMKALFAPSGDLEGQPVERGSVAQRVRELIKA